MNHLQARYRIRIHYTRSTGRFVPLTLSYRHLREAVRRPIPNLWVHAQEYRSCPLQPATGPLACETGHDQLYVLVELPYGASVGGYGMSVRVWYLLYIRGAGRVSRQGVGFAREFTVQRI